jgi:hypothetical protein
MPFPFLLLKAVFVFLLFFGGVSSSLVSVFLRCSSLLSAREDLGAK